MSREQALEQALRNIIAATHSHVDGRDLLAELHPRKQLDIKRRIDARETWFEADWLSTLWGAVKDARKVLAEPTSGVPGLHQPPSENDHG